MYGYILGAVGGAGVGYLVRKKLGAAIGAALGLASGWLYESYAQRQSLQPVVDDTSMFAPASAPALQLNRDGATHIPVPARSTWDAIIGTALPAPTPRMKNVGADLVRVPARSKRDAISSMRRV